MYVDICLLWISVRYLHNHLSWELPDSIFWEQSYSSSKWLDVRMGELFPSLSKLLKLCPTIISPMNSVVESFLGEYRSKFVSGKRVVVWSKYLNPRPRFIVNGRKANLLLNNKIYNFPDPSLDWVTKLSHFVVFTFQHKYQKS